ncbi:MAG: pilus assembly protein PilO [Leptolyngbyaceae cyanobacterium CAN_BIN12]|nr:pilus assembly protein PilO [Leptolyngbyaceae cyanobacterium CAN_BIN12]
MSTSGDFIPGDQPFDAGPDYPTVFGIRFTPTVSGIALALLGLLSAGALLFYLGLPEWERYQQLDAKVKQTENDIQQQQALLQEIGAAKKELEVAQRQRDDVLTLFANEASLETLLLDLNRQIDARNVDLGRRRSQKIALCPPAIQQNVREFEDKYGDLAARAEMKGFTPNKDLTGVITDSSYGAEVNGKLKRQVVSVELAGNYEQTSAILQSIERLQPLLVIRELTSTLSDKSKNTTVYTGTGDFTRLSPCQPDPKITTKFQLEALLPLKPEERVQAAPVVPQPDQTK